MITFSRLGKFGRLGNQLFQVAATIAAAERCGQEAGFPSWPYADLFVGPFGPMQASNPPLAYSEPHFHYAPVPCRPADLVGYFQSWRYFHDSGAAAAALRWSRPVEGAFDVGDGSCAVHVRRTDYLGLPDHHPVLPREWYEAARDIVRSKVYGPAVRFIAFSDDPAWCRENLPWAEVVEGRTEVQDLYAMSRCAWHIIANSSFSWWGAYLRGLPPVGSYGPPLAYDIEVDGEPRRVEQKLTFDNSNSLVVAPKRWFGPAYPNHDTRDLYPPEWHVL